MRRANGWLAALIPFLGVSLWAQAGVDSSGGGELAGTRFLSGMARAIRALETTRLLPDSEAQSIRYATWRAQWLARLLELRTQEKYKFTLSWLYAEDGNPSPSMLDPASGTVHLSKVFFLVDGLSADDAALIFMRHSAELAGLPLSKEEMERLSLGVLSQAISQRAIQGANTWSLGDLAGHARYVILNPQSPEDVAWPVNVELDLETLQLLNLLIRERFDAGLWLELRQHIFDILSQRRQLNPRIKSPGDISLKFRIGDLMSGQNGARPYTEIFSFLWELNKRLTKRYNGRALSRSILIPEIMMPFGNDTILKDPTLFSVLSTLLAQTLFASTTELESPLQLDFTSRVLSDRIARARYQAFRLLDRLKELPSTSRYAGYYKRYRGAWLARLTNLGESNLNGIDIIQGRSLWDGSRQVAALAYPFEGRIEVSAEYFEDPGRGAQDDELMLLLIHEFGHLAGIHPGYGDFVDWKKSDVEDLLDSISAEILHEGRKSL